MAASHLKYLKQILPDLYQLPVEYPFGPSSAKTHSYVLQRYSTSTNQYENFMIYGSCHIAKCYDDIQSIGGISRIYLNHRDEASKHHKAAYELFKSPTFCHINELKAVQESTELIHNKTLFTFNYDIIHIKHNEFEDFDIIPSPGHCKGATFYGWKNQNNDNKYYMFCGDTLYMMGSIGSKKWNLAPLTFHPYHNKYNDTLNTIKMLKTMSFDYLIPGLHGNADNVDCYDVVYNDQYKNDILDNILNQITNS